MMLQKCCIFLFILFVFIRSTTAQKIPVIVDTDGAPDDFRAIVMLLAGNRYDIHFFICTEGTMTADSVAAKIWALQNNLKTKIPVFKGNATNLPVPPFRKNAGLVLWGNPVSNIMTLRLSDSLPEIPKGCIYLALGPLTNAAFILEKPKFNHVERLVWYNTVIPEGFNYSADTAAYHKISKLPLDVEIISNKFNPLAIFDNQLMAEIQKINNAYARQLTWFIEQPAMRPLIESQHLTMWDDLAVAYLYYPSVFQMEQLPSEPRSMTVKNYDIQAVKMIYPDIIQGNIPGKEDIVFSAFPTENSFYQYDIRNHVEKLSGRYGEKEWKAAVLVHEFHQHLGIYSIIGVKMGIRAREFFNAGIDEINVISMAGFKPPLSCLNDGLQCSTGATLGRGTIQVHDSIPQASAIFMYKGRSIRISLKPAFSGQIEKDITDGILKYGNLSNGYWQMIRELSIKYWIEWDRTVIFDIIELPAPLHPYKK